MRIIFTFAILSIIITALEAQTFSKGYIITANGEKKIGFIQNMDSKKAHNECNFKENDNSKIQTFMPSDISEYGYDGYKRYKAIMTDIEGIDSKIFVEVILSGKASLYVVKNIYYAQKEGTPLYALIQKDTLIQSRRLGDVIVKDKKYVPVLKNLLFADCERAMARVDNTSYNETAFITLFMTYNSCFGGDTTAKAETRIPSTKMKWGIASGVNMSKAFFTQNGFAYSGVRYARFNFTPSVIYGAAAELTFPRFSRNFTFTGQMMTSKHNYKGIRSEISDIGTNIVTETSYGLRQFHIPITMQYSWDLPKFKPFIGFGLGFNATSQTIVLLKQTYSGTNFSIPRTQTDTVGKTGQGSFILNAGIKIPLKKHLLTAEIRFDEQRIKIISTFPNVISTGISDFNSRNLMFLLGFYF
jgi:hypothetical protein